MSLEMHHPPIPLTPKDSEFLHRRPELFLPYLQNQFNQGPGSGVSETVKVMHGLSLILFFLLRVRSPTIFRHFLTVFSQAKKPKKASPFLPQCDDPFCLQTEAS